MTNAVLRKRPSPPLSNIKLVRRLGWDAVEPALRAAGMNTSPRQQAKWEERGLSRDALSVVTTLAAREGLVWELSDLEARPPYAPTPRQPKASASEAAA